MTGTLGGRDREPKAWVVTGSEWVEMGAPSILVNPWQMVWSWHVDRSMTISLVAYETPSGVKITDVPAGTVVSGDTFTFSLELK